MTASPHLPDGFAPPPDSDLLRDLIARALSSGGDFAEIYYEERVTDSLSLEDGRVDRSTSGVDRGLGVRVTAGAATGYAYSDDLSLATIREAAQTAGAAARSGTRVAEVALKAATAKNPVSVGTPPAGVAKALKAAVLTETDEAARAVDGRVRQVRAGYADVLQFMTLANSEGLLASDVRCRLRMSVQVIAAEGDRLENATKAPGWSGGFEYFDRVRPAEVGREAAERAVLMLGAAPSPAGRMPVIIGHGFGGVLFHEACGHGLEADHIYKASSIYAGKLEQAVASSEVSAYDDPSLANGWGSFTFDDEGVPSARTVLIEKGTLRSYLYDRLSSARLGPGQPRTPNGRRESFRHMPVPRMTNTFIGAGTSSVEEIIAATQDGLYAKSMGGGQVNPTTGDFVFAVTEAYRIRGGRIAEPVRGATLTGNGIQALMAVDMVASDLELEPGTCGKEGQWVPAAVGQPTLRVRELTVGGTAL